MRLLARGLITTIFVLAALIAAFFIAGPERIWGLFGPPDFGPVEFETLARRATPNDALACPPGICKAASDVTPPEYGVGAADLRRAFSKRIAAEPRITTVAISADPAAMTDRYIQRSAQRPVAGCRRFRLSVASELGSRLDQFKRIECQDYRPENFTFRHYQEHTD